MLTERLELLELERLDVAGATLRTDELLDCCDTLRVELLPDTLRLELLPDTLRVELEFDTLWLELLPDTLRLDAAVDTVRLSDELFTDLEAIPEEVVTERLELEPNDAVRSEVLRLRFLSQPPLLILRLGL